MFHAKRGGTVLIFLIIAWRKNVYSNGRQCGSSLSGVTKVSWYIALSEFAWAWLRSVARMR